MHLSEVVEPPVFEHIEQQLEAEKRVSTEDSTHSSTTSTQPIGHGLVIRRRRTTRRTKPEQVSSVGNVTHTCDTRHDTEQEDATTSKIVEQQHTNTGVTVIWLPLCFVYPHTYNNYQYRVIVRLSHFSLTGTVSTLPNVAKEKARSTTIITRPSGSRFS